jgi:hypothetical protein
MTYGEIGSIAVLKYGHKNCRHPEQSSISFLNIQYATCFDREDDPQAFKKTRL